MTRLNCLDGLRGLLALYVLLVHTLPWAPLPLVVSWPIAHGEAAVDLFFVLSGLVIAASVEHFDYRARPFLIARAARIFPVFLPVFVLAVIAQPVAIDFAALPWIGPDDVAHQLLSDGWPPDWGARIAAHLLMLHGVLPAGVLPDVWVSFLGSAWSLSTEWQFYALVALIGARLGRAQAGLWRLTLLLLAMAVFGVGWQYVAAPDWQFTRAFLPNKAAYFALGVASGALLRDPAAWQRFGGVLAIVLLLCLARENPLKLLVPLIWLLCLMAQVARTRSGPSWPGLRVVGRLLDGALPRWLGGISYSLYLVNEPVQKLLGVALSPIAGGDAVLFSLLWLPGAILVPIGVAGLLRKRVELPALRAGRAWAHGALDRATAANEPPLAATGAVFSGAALRRPLLTNGIDTALADARHAYDFESVFARREHLAGYTISPDPTQVVAHLGEEARRIVLGSSVVVWLSQDAGEAARQRARLSRLCRTRCPYRVAPGAGQTDRASPCNGSSDECRRWLAQHGIAGVDLGRLDDARRDAMRRIGPAPHARVRDPTLSLASR